MAATVTFLTASAPIQSPLVRRVGPWLGGSLVCLAALWKTQPVEDPDTFWHIRTGAYLQDHWTFIGPDPFGAGASKPWSLNQWLPELAMNWADSIGGLGAVVWLFDLGLIALALFVWIACRRRSSSLVSSIVLVIVVVAMAGSLSPRPQLVTFALTALTADVWLRTAVDRRPRWWLIPLSWAWACSHGMWFLGPVVGLVVLLGMALERPKQIRRLAKLLVIPLASVPVAALTPAGPAIVLSPLQVSEVTQYIQEWQPSESSYPPFVAALVLVTVLVVHASRTREGRRWTTVLLGLLATFFILRYGRTIAVAAVILAPLVAQALQEMTRTVRERVTRREKFNLIGLPGAALVVAAMMSPALAIPAVGPNALGPELDALPAGTVICNDWGDGGWLIYEQPNVRVTMDSRVEIYSTQHIEDYLKLLRGRPGWQKYVSDNGCEYGLFGKDESAAEVMTLSGWQMVAAADDYVLMKAPRAS